MVGLIINISFYTSLLLLLSWSFQVIYVTAKFFHIAHAITITFGAYITYFFTTHLGFSLAASIPIAILFTIVINVIFVYTIYLPLQKRKTPNWQMLITSLGIYIILQNLVSIYFGDDTKSFRSWEVVTGHHFLGAYITDVQIITMAVVAVLFWSSWLFFEKSITGKKIKAVASNSGLSNIFGISTDKAILYSFILGSALAAVAGILIASDSDMNPTMGFNWLLYAVVAMIIGGIGKFRHLLIGSLLLATAQHLSAYYLDSKWMNAIAYLILIIFLFFKPYGFSSKGLKKAKS